LYFAFRKSPERRWVKYAGNWAPADWEPWSYKFQRWLLKKDIPSCVVTINGEWPEQPERIISFNNPSFSKRELTDARALCSGKELGLPLKLLFVGRLEDEKGAHRALEIAKALVDKGIKVELIMIGDGPLRFSYELFVQENGLSPTVRFLGWQPRAELVPYYLRSHFILLPTAASEGWPKVLSEAMACGTVPLAGDVSAIPQVLKKIGAGQAFPPHDLGSFVNAIQVYIENPQQWKKESLACISAAEGFTYEAYLEHVKSMFNTSWGVDISI
jgi:glycosyltransferase involved in cell wall biosynthesis